MLRGAETCCTLVEPARPDLSLENGVIGRRSARSDVRAR